MTTLIQATGETGDTDCGPYALSLPGQVRAVYKKYVTFHSDYEEAEAGTVALWTMHTYVYDVFECAPHLLITAPTSAAGKSRVFDVPGF